MTLYADVLLLVNGVMNSLILWITAKFTRKPVSFPRLAAGGLVMALLHGIVLFTPAIHIHPLPASVFILSAGIALALRPARPRLFFKAMALAYAASFAVGGLGMGLFYLTDFPYALHIISGDLSGLSRSLPWYLPVICVLAAYLGIKITLRLLERLTLKRQSLCPVRIVVGDSAVCFDALVDTGHSLREPISKLPVIVAEFEQIKIFLPDNLQTIFFEKQENNLETLAPSPFCARLRMIPFTSLGRAHGMLIGFRPDGVRVGEVTVGAEVVIGIYNSRLTRDGRYQGLVSPELLRA